MKSKGLGDSIEKFTKFTGIDSLVELLIPEGEDCGCDKRKAWLNKQFPYKINKDLLLDQFKKGEIDLKTYIDGMNAVDDMHVMNGELS